jgi:hypothetical protein
LFFVVVYVALHQLHARAQESLERLHVQDCNKNRPSDKNTNELDAANDPEQTSTLRAELSRLAADGFRDSLDRAKSNLRSEKVDLSIQFFKHGSIRICRQKVRRDEYLHDLSGRTAKVINFY